jgi:hypothetical protein
MQGTECLPGVSPENPARALFIFGIGPYTVTGIYPRAVFLFPPDTHIAPGDRDFGTILQLSKHFMDKCRLPPIVIFKDRHERFFAAMKEQIECCGSSQIPIVLDEAYPSIGYLIEDGCRLGIRWVVIMNFGNPIVARLRKQALQGAPKKPAATKRRDEDANVRHFHE